MRIDTRAGSQEYIVPLRKAGLHVDEAILPAGDVELIGNGPGGRPQLVGVELKKLPDLFACIRNGRFAEQLRGMKANYEISWLVVEGRLKLGAKLQYHTGEKWRDADANMTYAEMAGWTMTMAAAAGVLLWRTENEDETVAWLKQLDSWWTAKVWEDHRAHLEYYTPPAQDSVFDDPTLCQRVARVLPGLGSKRAEEVAKAFGSTRVMVNASIPEWTKIEGIGRGIAEKITRALTDKGRHS